MAHSRFVNKTLSELQETNRSSIFDYDDAPVLTLEEAVEKINPPISGSRDYVTTAKKKFNPHSSLLTRDESAAIYLYTMPVSFYSALNNTLRAENRHALTSWFAFLKLFITALEKLPSMKATIWRGVNYDDTLTYVDNDVHIWWSVNSCSINPERVQTFLGESGTLFIIDAIYAKDISAFSAIPDEQEVVLMPGTRVRRRYDSLSFIDRLFVLHLEEINPQSKSQSESNYLFEQIRQEYQRNNRLQRIINPAKSFPIEQSYINLAIVTTKDQHEKEKQLRETQPHHVIMNSFEKIHDTKTGIEVKDIFHSCKNPEKQVLVFGRAGIGKSTLCRYIAYQWARGSYWSQYELLALIPLRRLTINRYPPDKTYTLIDLIKKEVFPCDLTDKEETLLKNQFDAKKTLWILDGYDEIVQNVPPHLECLFEQLLKTPHHILTSRPYLNTLSYDVQMEITGFTDKNIEEYVQHFFNQMKDELDNATIKSQTLLKFLKSNRSIWGVAHIPVNLELICSLWSNGDWSETEQLTMTTLYNMMTEWLCRRYLRTQDNQAIHLSEDEINQRCQNELRFLESLAFNAMQNNTIIIRPSLLKKALNEAEVSSQEQLHVLNIGILKSFNKQGTGIGTEMKKDHYFIHLSFQEYFAARYLINVLKGSASEKAIQFIKHQKYTQRYTLLFTFASGLLTENDSTPCINIFWDTILGEPLDLAGIRHMQLVISCLEETSDQSAVPRRSELLEWISKCIKHSFFSESENHLRHLLQSLQSAPSVACHQTIINVLINLLQYDDIKRKSEVLWFIGRLEISNPPTVLITSITTLLNDKNGSVRQQACQTLGTMGEKAATNEVISKLANALGDESEKVRSSACEVLRRMGEKVATNEVISKLVSALGDESAYVRCRACEVLGNMGEKTTTNELIPELMNALGNENQNVRKSARMLLGKMGEQAATDVEISTLLSRIEDENQFVRSSACYALEKIGDKGAANEVISKLLNALEDENQFVRNSACYALGKMGEKAVTKEVISKLVSVVGDENVYVRKCACEFFGKMGEKAATNDVIAKLMSALEDEHPYVRGRACYALGEMSENTAPNVVTSKLVSALEDESEYVRWNACRALGKMGEKVATNEVISGLMAAIGDKSEHVRGNACYALGEMSENTASNVVTSKLVSALEDESEYVRWNACRTLGKMGEKVATNEVINKLVSALGDESEGVRASGCDALGKMGKKAATNEVISKLLSTMKHKDVNEGRRVYSALVAIVEIAATNEVIRTLLHALEDESADVRWHARRLLEKIGEKAAANEVISKLMDRIEDENQFVRSSACYALGKMGEKGAANEVISKLMNALEDENQFVRNSACYALGWIGEKAATNEVISKLVSALGDASEGVRKNACDALGKMGEKAATNEVINKLVGTLEDEREYIRRSAYNALGKMGEKAATNEVISKLVSALEDESEDVRRSACNALGKMGEKAATNEVISKLVGTLEDESEDVRRSACYALGNRGEKAATNEVLNKLIIFFNDTENLFSMVALNTVKNILSSSTILTQLDPQVVSAIWLSEYGSECLENVSCDQLMNLFLTTKNPDWLSVMTQITVFEGAAVTVINDKVVVYGRKEPLELFVLSSDVRQQLVEGFTDQAKRLYLAFETSSEA